ncbi:integrase [Lachnospiraceae bacterium PF1-21]|uniref:Site-specific integrase n=1 Tax=Ohessyouella blattaphilus TaxID=2949333 RepID=A0ABT1EJJ4_9FIRM|nr:site-specific integrase [Ohessyouella blattaphilus]MCP1110874.1 site-specific integrase [Ohessyouella blattaphilus]MCR8564268.1 site-specific integrase [Ohessyouella blattaphilus]
MASIVKRKSKYAVVYTVTDENGVKRQKWESFATNADAKKRKAQVEYQLSTGDFIVPSAKTLKELLEEYVSIYGVNTWALSTYDSRKGLIDNYINPLIGDLKLDDITPRLMDKYYRDLLTVKAVPRPYQTPKNEYLNARRVQEIHKLLRNAFNQAVKWEMMTRNPVLNATIPKHEAKKREIWTSDILFKALELCDDDLLALALHLTFAGTLRMGELLGLTWDCVDISEESINSGTASIFIEKELQRVTKESMQLLNNKDVIRIFPAVLSSKHTVLVLKKPKTRTSVRKVFLPKTVAAMLVNKKQEIEELKDFFGEEYTDYSMVFCNPTGRPIEGQIINRAFSKLIRDNNLPKVVFHSLRHSSVTYKLKLNGGDMKSVQGDSGHAQLKMVADVYSHIIDDDRRINAQRLEETFYSKPGEKIIPEKKESLELPVASDEDKELLTKLLANPEMASLLKTLAKSL